jgi:hypothetical protein
MTLDRTLQKQLLEKLAMAYPEYSDVDGRRVTGDPVTGNLWYLEEHGLIEVTKSDNIGAPPVITAARINHRGLDFLADDGGLSAILDTVTIKFHADTLRTLLETKVTASDLSQVDKKRFIDHIRGLSAEALKTSTTHLVESALDHLPDAILLLQKALGF